MTMLSIDLDASAALRAELRADPRYRDDDTPEPRSIQRPRPATADISHHAAHPEETA